MHPLGVDTQGGHTAGNVTDIHYLLDLQSARNAANARAGSLLAAEQPDMGRLSSLGLRGVDNAPLVSASLFSSVFANQQTTPRASQVKAPSLSVSHLLAAIGTGETQQATLVTHDPLQAQLGLVLQELQNQQAAQQVAHQAAQHAVQEATRRQMVQLQQAQQAQQAIAQAQQLQLALQVQAQQVQSLSTRAVACWCVCVH